MCGIGLLYLKSYSADTAVGTEVGIDQSAIKKVLKNRGPDHQDEIIVANDSLWATATVLHIQGEYLFPQPVVDVEGNVLMWNGEVFDGIEVPAGVSDTKVILEHLTALTISEHETDIIGNKIVVFLASIKGPFSFIFYHHASNHVFFGRDSFGRRSLTMYHNEQNMRALSSTTVVLGESGVFQWKEVEIGGIYKIPASGTLSELVKIPWHASRVVLKRELALYTEDNKEDYFQESVDQFVVKLKSAISKRVKHIGFHLESEDKQHARIGVLFSGGIDSLLLAAVLHLTLPQENEPIELFNIAFVNEGELTDSQAAPDRLAAIAGCIELQKLFPSRKWRLVHVDVPITERNLLEDHVKHLILPLETHMDLNIGNAFFFASRGKGYLQEHTEEEVAKAYEAAIDDRPLLRIGEEGALKAVGLATQGEGLEESREKFYQTQSKDMSEIDLKPPCIIPLCKRVGKLGCPRRLCKRCCDRAYREEQVAITNDPTRVYVNNCPVHKTKQKQIKAMNAKRGIVATVEDEEENSDNDTSIEHKVPNSSIGSNGDEESSSSNVKVHEISSAPKISYQSKCKILLVGLGADEQLAGYGRHRTCFAKGGWEALCQELNMDLTRLWQRNLGRDDRCISDNGREGWFPFLDEDFVSFVQATPINIITDLSMPAGVGDKRILRTAAARIGLAKSTQLIKRAIQFGSMAAKQTSVQYYGSKRKGKGNSKI